MIAFALTAWAIGLIAITFFSRHFIKAGYIAALAVLVIVVIHIFLRPLMFFTGVDSPYPYNEFGPPDWILIAMALLLATIWVILFSVTHQLSVKPAQLFKGFLPKVSNGYSVRLIMLATLFTSALGAFLTLKLVVQAGGFAGFVYSVKIGKELTGSYIIREISIVAAIFSMLALISYAKRRRDKNLKIATGLMVWLCFVLLLFNCGFNYLWGNRYSIAMLFISLIVAWHFHINRMSFFKLLVVLIVALSLLQGLKVVRNVAVKTAVGGELVSTQSFWLNLSTSMHMSQFDAYMLALRDAGDRFEYRYGKDFFNGLMSWIPRSLYPEKESFHIGGWFRRVYQPTVVNGWPVTTPGSWYVNFGIIGIIFGAIFSGFLAAIFDASFRAVKDSSWQAVVSPALAFFLFDGGVGTGFVQGLVLYAIPLFLLAIILRIFKSNKSYLKPV